MICEIERGISLLKSNDIMSYVSQVICEVDSELYENLEIHNHSNYI